jgi:hypothetical protein
MKALQLIFLYLPHAKFTQILSIDHFLIELNSGSVYSLHINL